MSGFEFPNETARIAVFATLGSLIFLIFIFVLALVIRICCCGSKKRRKGASQISLQPIQQVAVVEPQVKQEIKKELPPKAPTSEPVVQEFHESKPEQVKPVVQFNDETEIVPNLRYHAENPYEEIPQPRIETANIQGSSASSSLRGSKSRHESPNVDSGEHSSHIVPLQDDNPIPYGVHIPTAEETPKVNPPSERHEQQINDYNQVNSETYPAHHGYGHKTEQNENELIAGNTVPAKVRKAKKEGKGFLKPKKFKGKPKEKKRETPPLADSDVMPAMVAPQNSSIIPEEDRMY